MIVKLMAEESSAGDPTKVDMSEYSSIDSSEGDYTEPEGDNKPVDDYFLFQNVRKIARRKRRKMAPEEYRKTKEKKKLIEYVSESDSSSDDDSLPNNQNAAMITALLDKVHSVPQQSPKRTGNVIKPKIQSPGSDISSDDSSVGVGNVSAATHFYNLLF